MFCPECGTKAPEGATFCQNCGMNLAEDTPTPQPAAAQAPVQSADSIPENTPKKKSKTLPIILGVTVLVIAVLAAAVLAVVMLNRGEEIVYDYKATVREYQPYAKSQKMPYTCGEVFDRYIAKAEWDIQESDGGADVEISGTMKGTDKKIVVSMRVETDEDRAVIESISVRLDGKKPKEDAFFALFVAYDQDERDLSQFEALLNDMDAALNGDEETPPEPESETLPSDLDTAGGLMLYGITLDEIMGMTPADVVAVFGTYDNWADNRIQYGIHDMEESIIYDDGWMEFDLSEDLRDGESYVTSFSTEPYNLTLYEQNLAQHFDMLVAILGDDYFIPEGTTYSWMAMWTYGNYDLLFEFPNTDDYGLESDFPYAVYVYPAL